MPVNRSLAALLIAALAAACGGSPRDAGRTTPADSAHAARPDTAPAPAPVPAAADTTAPFADDTTAVSAPVRRPPPIRHVPQPATIRALYVSRAAARSDAVWSLIALARQSTVNALVFDVKDDQGQTLYRSTVSLAHVIGADTAQPMPARRLHALMDSLRRYRIYPVARIAVARDPLLAARRPQWGVIRRPADPERNAWLDPRHREVWAYAADLASEAVARGFSAVLFADARFPDSRGQPELLELTSTDGRTRSQVIRDELGFLSTRTDPLSVPVAVDVTGLAAVDSSDLNTGQRWEMVADRTDILAPTMFPSRFPAGALGMTNAAAQPGEAVGRALAAARRRSDALHGAARIVPWYQAFGAGAQPVDPAFVRAQIVAGEQHGFTSWMLWNPDSRYVEAMWRDTTHTPASKPKAPAKAKPPAKATGRAGGRSRR
jgi:hypothetical protein